ncbi:SGNH/GDSL hydrolase family protein [Arthrobacter castelli]|uniref:SGNH/GDSL hydrolase family protein n=1 Tax=Arthrobacter castelli TaxID=271431 RepID=UPI0004047B72|nr:SGNH/GDSL hydrolase family protein [Arthrobacter castelli]
MVETTSHHGIQVLTSAGAVAAGGAVLFAALVSWEAVRARKTTEAKQSDYLPLATGRYDDGGGAGEPLHMAVLGDSLAVGLGAETPDRTLGALLAQGLSHVSGRPVQLNNVAVVGARSSGLPGQFATLMQQGNRFDVALIVIGGNDIVNLVRPRDAGRHLASVVHQLRSIGCEVVVASCPNMGTVRPLVQPLRTYAYWASRLLTTTQTIVVLRAGGRTVSLADLLGPMFWRQPKVMFSSDHFHPSSLGYARAADVLLPSICAAAGQRTRKEVTVPHRVHRRGRRHPLAWLAFRASRYAGNEVSAKPGRDDDRVTIGRRLFKRLPLPIGQSAANGGPGGVSDFRSTGEPAPYYPPS